MFTVALTKSYRPNMLLEVSKRTAVTHLFNNLLKGTALPQRLNFTKSAGSCGIVENRPIPAVCKHWPTTTTTTKLNTYKLLKYCFSSQKPGKSVTGLDKLTFEHVCAETLDSISEYFEELVETTPSLKNADVIYSDGVLTVNLGQNHGTYVINRQTPNLQIWLSSPTSGPKRYDYIDGTWVYKHDKTTLHSLLDKEIKEIAQQEVEFVEKCLHSKPTV